MVERLLEGVHPATQAIAGGKGLRELAALLRGEEPPGDFILISTILYFVVSGQPARQASVGPGQVPVALPESSDIQQDR